MGMYTELHFNAELRRDVPLPVVHTLQGMIDGGDPMPCHEHPLFLTHRWRWMLTCDSAYFPMETHSTIRHDDITDSWFLSIRSNLKNYDDEIEKFIDWIDPYVDAYPGEFLGFYRYEENDDPTLIRKREDVTNQSREQGD